MLLLACLRGVFVVVALLFLFVSSVSCLRVAFFVRVLCAALLAGFFGVVCRLVCLCISLLVCLLFVFLLVVVSCFLRGLFCL